MDMHEIPETFKKIQQITDTNEVICFFLDPPIQDFTSVYDGNLCIHSKDDELTIPFSEIDLGSFVTNIAYTIFDPKNSVLTWDIKKFLSYLRYHHRIGHVPKCNIIDLKYGSFYAGHRSATQPASFKEALVLSQSFITNTGWKKANQHVLLPLSLDVLPAIETKGLQDIAAGDVRYSWYEIEGQINGRLAAQKPSSRYLTVHSMDMVQKAKLRPRRPEASDQWMFLEFDYKNMEVMILHWLTQDEEIGAILDSGKDFYLTVADTCWPKGSEKYPIDIEGRRVGKMTFLPAMYGASPESLNKRLQATPEFAATILHNIKEKFSKSEKWLADKQGELVENKMAEDYFGRKRSFAKEPAYKRRNFEVQAPAALVCLERLCHLHQALPKNIVIHIHDGYILTAKQQDVAKVAKIARKALELPTPLCPGLKLKTSLKVGSHLADMKPVDMR